MTAENGDEELKKKKNRKQFNWQKNPFKSVGSYLIV
jgi:hypothetical protein